MNKGCCMLFVRVVVHSQELFENCINVKKSFLVYFVEDNFGAGPVESQHFTKRQILSGTVMDRLHTKTLIVLPGQIMLNLYTACSIKVAVR